jgi:alpha-L-rhamnosidase
MVQDKIKANWNLTVFFILGFQFASLGQQISELQNEIMGIWSQNTSKKVSLEKWKAQWIWMPESIQSDVMLARRSFNLEDMPEEALLRISASSKYELYINEKYISQGPARSAPHHQSFDILEVSSVLKEGKNTIAVRAHYLRGTTSYHLKGRAGLLVQLDLANKKNSSTVISDKNWKVYPDLSWDDKSPAMNRFQLFVNDRIDFNEKIIAFETLNFNDSSWLAAKPLLRNSGWPSPKKDEKATTLTTPWTSLIPRDIPYLNETEIKATHLIEAKKILHSNNKNLIPNNAISLTGDVEKGISKNYKSFLENDKPLLLSTLKENETWFLLFDFGKVINGMPKLSIEGARNTEVHILEAPFVVEDKFTHKIVASEFADQLKLSGNKDTWQAMYFKPTRYLAIVIKGNKETVKIHNIGIHQLKYPFELKGTIEIPEAPWLEDLWKASVKTIEVCTTDAFTDNYRERRQYAQTGYYAALGSYFTFGDTALQRRYLLQVAQEQEPNGIMPAYAPLTGTDFMIILDSNCLWIRSLYNYLLYSGDFVTVKELLPAAEKLITLLNSYTNELGMIDNPPYSYWLDHTINDRRGANLTLNGHYLGALEDYSKILEWLNKTEKSTIFKEKSEKLRKSLGLLWDAEKQLFADAFVNGKRSNQFSEHANAMALACKVATPEQAKIIVKTLLNKDKHNYIKRENGMTVVTPAMSYFLHKGLAEYGYEEASLHLLHDRFKKMLHSETNGTLWEEWWRNGTGRTGKFQERTRSDAQTESVFPPALIVEYVYGLKVTKPGIKEVLLSKPNFKFNNIKGEFPCPQGILSIHWKVKENACLNLSIPKGMIVKINIKSLNNNQNIQVNRKGLNQFRIYDGLLELKDGDYEIKF